MMRFLKETWELWYWAMFCPSRLQEQMNGWAPRENRDTRFNDILVFPISWRFFGQFCCLVSLFSLPLISLLINSSTQISWLLLPSTLLMAYGLAVLSLPIGVNIPLVMSGMYGVTPVAFTENLRLGLDEVQVILHFNNSLIFLTGGWISSYFLLFTLLISITIGILPYSIRDQLKTYSIEHSIAFICASTISATVAFVVAFKISGVVADAIEVGVEGLVAAAAASLVACAAACAAAFRVADVIAAIVVFRVASVVAVAVASVVAVAVASVVAVAVASVVAVAITSISTFSLLPFLIITAGVAFSFSSSQQRFWGVWVSGVLISVGTDNLGWQILWVLPVTFAFYYRVLPDYLLFAPVPITPNLNSLSNIRYRDLTSQHFARWLRRLPPYSSEMLWLPIPGHARLLAKVFNKNSTLGISTLQRMQASPLPGLTLTAQRALSDIVVGQLLKAETVASLQTLVPETVDSPSKNLLKVLLPTYYEPQLEDDISPRVIQSDIATLFPRLQGIAQGVNATLQANNYALKERGLEHSLGKLESLKATLPGLGLKANEIKRWQPVILRWQRILELELNEQQKLSQGELLNPFQYGNPLKQSQADLFKGRRTFVDDIVRLLLDRNRPTIVLHGPRRCGKTSFLNNLPRLLPTDWISVFVDIQSSAATADEISFLRSLTRAIRRDGRSQGIQTPNVPSREDFLSAPYDVFETWLEQVVEQLGDRYLILNLDEFEKIGTAINQGKLSLTLFDELRSLIQHWDRLGFIFSGVQTLDEIGPNWSSYFISVVPVEMLYLEPDEARELLTEPDPEFELTYAPGLVDGILSLTQSHPNLLQLIGAALVTEANERHTQIATAEMLEAAIPRAFELGTSYFTNVWTEFTGNPADSAEVRAGQIVLKALADDSQPNNPDQITRAALRRMERYHVLKFENNQYQFEIPLIKHWVKEYAILDDI